jgi:hypothetical protein
MTRGRTGSIPYEQRISKNFALKFFETSMSGAILPFEPELDEERIIETLLELDGSIAKTAALLDVKSARLRRFVEASPRCRAACEEAIELAVDEAVGVLFQGLRDENSFQNRFYAAKEFLRTAAARKRGFGHEASGQATLELKDKGGAKTITLRWIEPKAEPD